jgi:hypothetical protein
VSQRHAGWIALGDMYDDGGLSGGTMERPALKRLLEDIQAGKVQRPQETRRPLTPYIQALGVSGWRRCVCRTVRLIFRRYAELSSVSLLSAELNQLGIMSKRGNYKYAAI